MPFESMSPRLQHEKHGARAAPRVLSALLGEAGVRFNGGRRWDVDVKDERLFQRVLSRGSLGFGEAYMDGMWECPALDELFYRLMSVNIDAKLARRFKLRLLAEGLRHRLFNPQSIRRAFQVGERHYDIGNDIFEAMLDSGMNYSCGYWEHADDLERAQQHKLEMICRKLRLQAGEKLLEIGCGWGALMRYAAEHYAVEVYGVTVSKAQQELARQRCEGLPVSVELKDYREISGQFDKVVSVGMFEHVGRKNYRTFMDKVNQLMSDQGLFLLHTIGNYRTAGNIDPWIEKYIFPNGEIPSAREITKALEKRFLIEDWHNFGRDYDLTLMAWWRNFDEHWPELKRRYSQRFYRMWKYYLHSCAGFFRSRQGQLWQLVLNKRAYRDIYRSVR